MNGRRHRGIATGIIAILILIVGAGGVMLFLNLSDSAAAERAKPDLFTVVRGDFDISVPTSGELAAQNQREIKNLLETNAMIIEVVPEGSFVKKGDILFRLNDEEIQNKIVDAQDAIDQANNQLENSQANLEIAKKSRESQMAEAELRIRLADRGLEAWNNGDDVSKKKDLALAIKTSQMHYQKAKDRYEASVKLAAKDYISQDELKTDEISLVEREAQLEQARLAQTVYLEYNRLQEKEKLESELNQAEDEKIRIDQRSRAEVSSNESDVTSHERQLEREKERLTKLEGQLDYCVVKAPSDGLVVYWSSLNRDMRRNTDPPEAGTQLSRSQTVMVLPDTTNMVAEVKVNEALSGQIKPGQVASIVSDAFPEKVFRGSVVSVGVLAEGGGWRDPNRRDYTVRIAIDDGQDAGLKPSMRCKANILVEQVTDVVYVPVPAVFRNGPVSFVYIPDGSGFAQHEVKIGVASELYVQIVDGLEPGQLVLVREPSPDEITTSIPVQDAIQVPQATNNNESRTPEAPANARAPGGPDAPDAARGENGRRGDAGRGDGGRGGRGGQGGATSDAQRNRMREMMKEYDTDGDGELSESERAEAMKAFQGGGGGGGPE